MNIVTGSCLICSRIHYCTGNAVYAVHLCCLNIKAIRIQQKTTRKRAHESRDSSDFITAWIHYPVSKIQLGCMSIKSTAKKKLLKLGFLWWNYFTYPEKYFFLCKLSSLLKVIVTLYFAVSLLHYMYLLQ